MPGSRSPEEMRKAIARNLPARTGRTFEEWVEIAKAQGPSGRREKEAWLKSEHGLGGGTAMFIASESERPRGYKAPTPKQLLDAQYGGSRKALKPTYGRLATAVESLGSEAVLEPRKTYVSLNRNKQFGIIQARARTRVDLGLSLPGVKPTKRLLEAGSFGSERITHRVELTSPSEVDEQVLKWLKKAYDNA